MFEYNILSLVQRIAKDYPNKLISLNSILDYMKNDLKLDIQDKNKLVDEYVKTKNQFNLVTVGNLSRKLITICDNDSIKLPESFKNTLVNNQDKKELIDLDKFGNINKHPNKSGGISVKFTLDNLIRNGLPKPVTYKELDYRIKDYLNYVVTGDQPNIEKYVDKANKQLDRFIEFIAEVAIQVPNKKVSRNALLSLLKGNNSQNELLLRRILLDAHMMTAKDFKSLNKDNDDQFAKKYPKQNKALNKMVDGDLIMDLKGYESKANDKTRFNMKDFVKVPECVTYDELLKNLRNIQIK